MQILTICVGMIETNCYVAYDPESLAGCIIDPGDQADRIIGQINQVGIKPQLVLLTHAHADHIGAVNEIMKEFGISYYAGKGEEKLLSSATENFSAMYGTPITLSEPKRLLDDGDVISCASIDFIVYSTPGHSPGGVCYHHDNIVFCGDTLFNGSVGRTDFPGCSHELLIDSISQKLLTLPDETICYPGHGPATTIGDERRHNPFITGSHYV